MQDIPKLIQNILIKFGAREKINHRSYLRYFKHETIIKLKKNLRKEEYIHLICHSNSYLIQSQDEKTIITMGIYYND